MSLKKLAFNAPLRSTKVVDVYQREKVFTNDKETVELNFTVTDMTSEDLTTATAEVLLYMKDGSFFQVTDVTKTDNVFTYVMSDTQGKHPGLAKTQLVVTIGTKKYASQLFEFFVNAGLDGIVANEVMIQDWTTLTTEARAFIDQAELDEAQRIANENERIAAENQRINDFSSKADKTYVDEQFSEKVDKETGKGLSTNDYTTTEKNKLAGIPADTAAQLADKANQATTYTKTEVDNALSLKANKVQEAWITPTLLNGWVNNGEFNESVGYMKDNFGFVHIKGFVTPGLFDVSIFTLPVGYRPSKNVHIVTTRGTGVGRLIITSQGSVNAESLVGTGTTSFSLNNIKFKVV